MKMTAKRTKKGGKKVIVNAVGLQIKLKKEVQYEKVSKGR